jgi:hemolysin III
VPKDFSEEAFSFFTHLGGALLAILGLILLVERADGPLETTTVSIYGGTLVAMFLASALHHLLPREDGALRRLDMTAVYLLIAGTYTPTLLLTLAPVWAWSLVGVVWTLAIAGIVLRWTTRRMPRWATVGLYLALGWIAIIGIAPLSRALSWQSLALLVSGGVVYSLGAVVYARARPDPWPRFVGYHGLWHMFVLVGAGLHFALVWNVAAT